MNWGDYLSKRILFCNGDAKQVKNCEFYYKKVDKNSKNNSNTVNGNVLIVGGINMDWINEISKNYGTNKPLVFKEIQNILWYYSVQRVYQLIDQAIEEEKLIRFGNGIYYVPTKTIFGISKLDPAKVVFRKYIANDEKVYGYYSGLTLLNGLGLTTQVSNIIEVVTNKEASRVREIYVGRQRVRLRRARVLVTNENVDALSILDLFNQLDPNKVNGLDWSRVIDYIKESKLTLKKVLEYSSVYPAKAIKNLMNSGIMYEVA